MPYAVPQGGILEVSIKGRFENQVCLSVMHYKIDSAGGTADGDLAIDTFDAAFNAAGSFVGFYLAACHADYVCDQVVYQWIKPTRFRRVTKNPIGANGAVAGAKMPPNVSFAISKLGIHATRHGRGTLHMPAVPSAHVVGGTLSVAGGLAYLPIAQGVSQTFLAGSFIPVLLNRGNFALSEDVVNGRVETTSRVQRRRTVGLGI